MLRTSLRSVRAVGGRNATAGLARQWPRVTVQRQFADASKPPPAAPTSSSSAKATIPPIDPTPKSTGTTQSKLASPVAAPSSSSLPTPPPAPRRRGFFRRLRNLILTLTLLGSVAFGGGVWYSRINDNFHDFFTEYIPFGEQAVLYLEELDLRKRGPHPANPLASKPHETGGSVSIPAKSGASWRVADGAEGSGRQHSAVDKAQAGSASKAPKSSPSPAPEKPKTADPVVKQAEPKAEEKTVVAAKEQKPVVTKAAKEKTFKAPEVDEPSRLPPLAPIDPLGVPDAIEPVVGDLVRMLNDVITVINADGANGKYGSTMAKAKNEIAKVGRKIHNVRKEAEKKAAEQVRERMDEFDNAATDLVKRVEATMAAQEARWKQEFDEEMARVRTTFEERARLTEERERQLQEQKAEARLLEQAVALRREFKKEVAEQVEKERQGRLGRLASLSTAVTDLEKLTSGWNDVVDLNLQTQQLHVAVEAVRASLEDSERQHNPRPFVRELAALKEIAKNDPVVDAAISSINPSAYQRGLSSPSQLVDRFRRVADEVRKASLLPEDAGVASHVSSWALSKVMFRKSKLAPGSDVESILTRTQTLLEEGNLEDAAREANSLQGWAKTLSRDWLAEVRKVLEVQQALEVIATEARLQSLRVE